MNDEPISRRRRWVGVAAVLCIAGLGAWWYSSRAPKPPAPAPKLSVQVTRAETRAMPQVLQGVGKVVAQASAEVRPQTGGVIKRVFIQDGERVVAGQKLFELEAQPLASALAQAQAQWARDKALADDAAAAQARLKPLADKEYVSAREYEAAVNAARSAQATAAATRTTIEQARIALNYAVVVAPISGRAGAVLVKPGNLVAANNATALVVVNATRPVDVLFALPQNDARRLRDALAALPAGKRMAVEARDSATQKLRASGELVFIDNSFNDSSGTVALKARFANGDEALWPGEFYAMRITLKTDDAAVVVPDRALQQGQNGSFVYVVDNGKAKLRMLKVDRVLDGFAVIASGLASGEPVLAAVPTNLRDGSAVQVASAASAAASAASP